MLLNVAVIDLARVENGTGPASRSPLNTLARGTPCRSQHFARAHWRAAPYAGCNPARRSTTHCTMRRKLLDTTDGRRTFAIVFERGDEVAEGLLQVAKDERLEGSQLTGIGALQDVVLGYWDWDTKDYKRIGVREQVEVLSLIGNVALGPDGTPKVHAHIVIGKADGSAHGGHLLEAHVRPTLEVIVTELPSHLQRRTNPETQLPLLVP